ncbi:3611_t:CDS:2, partial [Gigaspora rosea]
NKSLNELKVQFDREVRDAKRVYVSDSYIYIDIEANNVIIHPNTPPGLNTQPFETLKIQQKSSEKHVRLVFMHVAKKDLRYSPATYIITARSCYFKESNFPISLYLRNWDTGNPNHLNKGL